MPNDFGPYAQREYERRWLLRELPSQFDPLRAQAQIIDHYIQDTRMRLRQVRSLTNDNCIFKLGQKIPEVPGALDRIVLTNFYLNHQEYEVFRSLGARQI